LAIGYWLLAVGYLKSGIAISNSAFFNQGFYFELNILFGLQAKQKANSQRPTAII
jgi:hypothetical protein